MISICIPVYNMGATIARTLDSCIAQTFKEFEVLVLDNCSSDDTFSIAETYANINSRIKVVKNDKNLGAYGNHNKCIELSNFKWIKFLHGDDVLSNNCLEEIVPYTTFGHGLIFFDYNGNTYYESLRDEYLLVKPEDASFLIKYGNFIGTPTTTLFNKEIFTKLGLFDLNLNPASDADAWFRITLSSGAIFVNKRLASLYDDPFESQKSYEKNRLMFLELAFKQLGKWKSLIPDSGRLNWDNIYIYEAFRFFDSSLLLVSKLRLSLLAELLKILLKKKILLSASAFYLRSRLSGKDSSSFRDKKWFDECQI